MSRRSRRRERSSSRPASASAATVAAPVRAAPRGPATRMRATGRAGASRAVGEPSPSLERAATAERAYVTKDFRRIGVVVVAMLVLLALSGVGVNALVR